MGWKTRTKQKRSSGGQKAQTNRRVRLDAAAAAEQVALGAAQALEPAGQEQAGLLEQGPAGSGLLEQSTTSSSPATSSSSPAVAFGLCAIGLSWGLTAGRHSRDLQLGDTF